MQQNIVFALLIWFIKIKQKCFTEYFFAAMDTKGRCYSFVEFVAKPPRVQFTKTMCM